MPQNFEIIKDVRLKSGSGIKISKRKKTSKQSMFEGIEFDESAEVSQEATCEDSNNSNNANNKAQAKYDSIGENEDSSDHLLPWEVKSGKKRKGKSRKNFLVIRRTF